MSNTTHSKNAPVARSATPRPRVFGFGVATSWQGKSYAYAMAASKSLSTTAGHGLVGHGVIDTPAGTYRPLTRSTRRLIGS